MSSRNFEANRFTAVTIITAFLLGGLTLLIYYLPAFHLVYFNPERGAAIESLCILIVLGAFYLCFARFVVTHELRLLLLALAFLLLGLYNMVHAVLVPVMGDRWDVTPELLAYFWLSAKMVTAVLILASLWAGSRKATPLKGIIGMAAIMGVVLALTGLFFISGASGLPTMMAPAGWELVPHGDPSDIVKELTTLGGLNQLLVGALFLAAGIGYLRLYKKESRPFWAWLSISFIVGFFSQMNYMVYPSIFTDFVASGDYMRLLSRVFLFVGTYAEVTYSFRQARDQNQELQALQNISTIGIKSRDISSIPSGIIMTVRSVFRTEAVIMLLPDAGRNYLEAMDPETGRGESRFSKLRIPLEEDSLVAGSFKRGETVTANDPQAGFVPESFRAALDIRNAIIAPMQTGNDTIGLLMVINKKRGRFGADEARFLTIIASRAAMVIENARLHERLEAAAVIEERTRLAREIHDGLAQNLGYLNLILPRVLGDLDDDKEKVREELNSMRKIVQDSLTEARQAIVDLQMPLIGKDFVDAVSDHARDFSDSAGIEVEVITNGKSFDLKPHAKTELVRIVQEALNNVRRHARASRVSIVFGGGDGTLAIQINDDGKGFHVDSVLSAGGRRSFGLASMKGRAEQLGGNLDIMSSPGGGTRITVKVPVNEEVW